MVLLSWLRTVINFELVSLRYSVCLKRKMRRLASSTLTPTTHTY